MSCTEADTLPKPGWAMRARLLGADLLAFDPHRLGWALALRAVVGLTVPLLLARALGQPLLVWVGLGAYLLAIGDCVDEHDRAQPLRIAVSAGLGSLALATGVLAGGSLGTAVAGMAVWGVITAMMGAYGSAFAAMSLPIAWAYVELGLPATDHSPANAMLLAGLFALGGLLLLLLTLTLRTGGAFAPVRAQGAACFREIARYLDANRAERLQAPETRARAAIAEARRLAVQAQRAAACASPSDQRTLLLIETADRLFSIIGSMRETSDTGIPGCKAALLAIARALDGQAGPAALRRLRATLEKRERAGEDASALGDSRLGRLLIQELSHALSLANGDGTSDASAAPTAATTCLAAALSPLIANLDRNSVLARHALRFAVVTSAAVVAFWVLPKPFGYWVPLTATVVLKPYAGLTLARAVQRAAGTAAGILAGLALMPFLPSVGPQFAAVVLLFFAMAAVLPFNYTLAIAFLSAGLIPFEHVLTPGIEDAVGPDRLVATAIGAALALIGGHVLWPTFERRGLPHLLCACTEAMAAYADAVIGTAQGDASAGNMQAGRRRAGLALSDLQAGVQHSLTEIGGDAGAITAILRASAALQRLCNTLNMLLQTAAVLAEPRPALATFRAALVPALADPGGSEELIAAVRAAVPAADGSPEAAVLSQALDRLTCALEMLHDALR